MVSLVIAIKETVINRLTLPQAYINEPDVILIGSGIMSANLGVMLKCLEPRLKIQVFEITDELAQEASHDRNNAGTGHAGICELSYTPSREADGSVNISRALQIFEQFEHSKQFWSFVVARGIVPKAADFIRAVPHIGFVHVQENVAFLRTRQTGTWLTQAYAFRP
jgi:malate dehydrogenase (quinone)